MRRNLDSVFPQTISLVLGLLLCIGLAGCMSPKREVIRRSFAEVAAPEHTARVNLFLNLEEKQGPAMQLDLSGIEILAGDLWLPVASQPMTLDSEKIGSAQLFLGGLAVSPGRFERIRMSFARGILPQADGKPAVLFGEPLQLELALDRPLSLEEGDSKTILFTWDVNGSLPEGGSSSPRFWVSQALRQLPVNMVFVACPEINTIFSIRTDKNWVVDSFGLQGRPSYLAVEPSLALQRLFVLAPQEKRLKVVDLSSQRVVESFPTLNDDATFMTISGDGRSVFLLYERSGYLSRMNLQTGQIEARVMLGARPKFMRFLDQQNLLAVSLSFSRQVVLLDPINLTILRTVSTGSNPEGLLVLEDHLYVAESGESSVSATDLQNISDQDRLMVGLTPRRLVVADNQIFVGNYGDGSLSVLLPGQLGAVQEIYGLGQPLEMVFDPFYRQLYISDEGEGGIAVLDIDSNQLLGYISLGAKPLGLAVIQ